MKLDIDYLAELAQLPLTTEDKQKLKPQLESIVTFVEQLNEIDTSDVPPTSNVSDITNAWREDQSEQLLTQEEALQNASQTSDGYFVTKGVFDGE